MYIGGTKVHSGTLAPEAPGTLQAAHIQRKRRYLWTIEETGSSSSSWLSQPHPSDEEAFLKKASTFYPLSLIRPLLPKSSHVCATSFFAFLDSLFTGHSNIRCQPASCTPHFPQLLSFVVLNLFFHFHTGPLSVLRKVYQVTARLPPLVIFPSPHLVCCLSSCLWAKTLCFTPLL